MRWVELRLEGGGAIGFDVSEAVTITLIGVATAFSLLALLSLMTAVLPRVVGLLGDAEEEVSEEEKTDERNKALAATIAVSVAMSRGHLPDVGGDSEGTG